ncbi:MAG: VOC family protein [Bacteroidales bacterium]|jgi:catechol 2,3-dioxygenase-like lactoylglutathione lyase family enzyme|nr:VOC family protein [Bacteroidales bacterium]
MKGYVICGIQQIGIGVSNLREAWKWYISQFGMDCRIFEDEAEAKLMLPYTGGQPRSRHAVLALNLQSGGGFEIWQYKGREPLPVSSEIRLGDLGIISCKMKVKNIDEAYSFYRNNGITLAAEPKEDPSGTKSFFVKDPFGNIFHMVGRNSWFMDEKKVSGGSYGAIIGVSDIEKARIVYSDILGYDEVIYDKTGVFPDLAILPGGSDELRRVLLRRTQPVAGPFSKLFGQSEIELISKPGKSGKKIYEGRFWGDLGFIHLCYDIRNMDELQSFCTEKGFPFTVDSKKAHEGNSFDMGEAAGHFSYLADTDGTLIEFVESHRIPLVKKLGWYLDLKKRDPYKSLPDWMIKTLRFSRVKL